MIDSSSRLGLLAFPETHLISKGALSDLGVLGNCFFTLTKVVPPRKREKAAFYFGCCCWPSSLLLFGFLLFEDRRFEFASCFSRVVY